MRRNAIIVGYACLLFTMWGGYAEEITVEEADEISPIAEATSAISTGIEPTEKPQTREEFLEALDEAVRLSLGGDRGEAVAAYLEIIAAGYNRTEPLYNLGVLAEYDEKGARYAGDDLGYAPAFYLAALEDDPEYYPARLNLAVVYHETGLIEDAAVEYRKLLGTKSSEEDIARYNLALIVLEQGRYEEAIGLLEGAEEPYADARRMMLIAYLNEKVGAPGRAIKLWKRALEEEDVGLFAVVAERHLRELRGY
ncbi:MAG: tetratricopeptide repeat protein [Candidatus Coatesbacteria bacterium]|nr:MAG: tetratricopeptide repeat protein [Candidatus Coatesbacteria bacterium]